MPETIILQDPISFETIKNYANELIKLKSSTAIYPITISCAIFKIPVVITQKEDITNYINSVILPWMYIQNFDIQKQMKKTSKMLADLTKKHTTFQSTIMNLCPHTNTTENRRMIEGGGYDRNWYYLDTICSTCGKVINTKDITNYRY